MYKTNFNFTNFTSTLSCHISLSSVDWVINLTSLFIVVFSLECTLKSKLLMTSSHPCRPINGSTVDPLFCNTKLPQQTLPKPCKPLKKTFHNRFLGHWSYTWISAKSLSF